MTAGDLNVVAEIGPWGLLGNTEPLTVERGRAMLEDVRRTRSVAGVMWSVTGVAKNGSKRVETRIRRDKRRKQNAAAKQTTD